MRLSVAVGLILGVCLLVVGRVLKEPWRLAKDGEDTVFRGYITWMGAGLIIMALIRLAF